MTNIFILEGSFRNETKTNKYKFDYINKYNFLEVKIFVKNYSNKNVISHFPLKV